MKCIYCPQDTLDEVGDLCAAHAAELMCHVLDNSPQRENFKCMACEQPVRFTEARIVRNVKNPRSPLSKETPRLCWVCTRLHHSAHQPEHIPFLP